MEKVKGSNTKENVNAQELQIIKDHIIQADSLKVMRMIADMNERESAPREA